MINPGFHHIDLKSMITTTTDRREKPIETYLAPIISDEHRLKSIDL